MPDWCWISNFYILNSTAIQKIRYSLGKIVAPKPSDTNWMIDSNSCHHLLFVIIIKIMKINNCKN